MYYMTRPVPVESAFALIDEKIKELVDWRGKSLAKRIEEIIRRSILGACVFGASPERGWR
jgi:hypothetical protein